MMSLIQYIQTFAATRRDDDKGAAMVEYGILVAGIAVLVMATVFVLGGAINGFFQDVVDQLT
jgi:pilus assembly protein Flp/PilA